MDREQYLEHLIPLALRLVGAVRDEGPTETLSALAAIHAVPAPADVDPNTAIAVLLAAMVNPLKSTSQLLGWTRGLIPDLVPDGAPDPAMNTLMVEMCLAGALPAHALSEVEIHRVVKILLDRGYTTPMVREHLHTADPADIRRWVNTNRARKPKPRTDDSNAA